MSAPEGSARQKCASPRLDTARTEVAEAVTPPGLRLWPSLPPTVYARRPAARLPFPLEEPDVALFARGRHALWHGLRAAGLGPGDEVLVPAYHCGTEVEVLARAGLTCRFYEATETLAPDEDELESLVTGATRALFLIHYFGFPQDGARWRGWCERRGLLLLEDCAQGWLAESGGRPVGTSGHVAIFSLAKIFPLPDGGALVSAADRPRVEWQRRPVGAAATAKRHARWLASRAEPLDTLLSRVEPERDERFELGDPRTPPSAATLFLLPRVADVGIAAVRRRNYARLLEEFGDHVPGPFAALPPGACPVIFPLEATDLELTVGQLRGAGVGAERFWPKLHPLLPPAEFPGALAWHDRFVALPVHDQLRPMDVERIAAALRATGAGRGR